MNILAMARGPQVEEGALDNKARMGRNLFRFAWMVEIIAAGIGLLIALTIVLQSIGTDSIGSGLGATTIWTNATLAALPFVVVAVVELTKIPLATAVYMATNWLPRVLFALGLIFLIVLTFETMFNGFERNFTRNSIPIDQTRDDISATEREIQRLETEVRRLEQATESDLIGQRDKAIAILNQDYETSLDQISNRRKALIEEQGNSPRISLESRSHALEGQIAAEESQHFEELRIIEERLKGDLESAAESYESKKTNTEALIAALVLEIKQLRESKGSLFSDINSIEDREQKRHESALNELRERESSSIEFVRAAQTERISQLRHELETKTRTIVDKEADFSSCRGDNLFTYTANTKKCQDEIDSLRIRVDEINRSLGDSSAFDRIAQEKEKYRKLFEEENTRYQNVLDGLEERKGVELGDRQANMADKEQELKGHRSELAGISLEGLRQKYRERFSREKRQITDAYRKRVEELRAEQSLVSSSIAQWDQANLDEGKMTQFLNEQEFLAASLAQQKAALEERFSLKKEEIATREATIESHKNRISEEEETKNGYIAQLNTKVRTNQAQVYRWAKRLFGKDNIADLTTHEVSFVAALWFGSLALIVASVGTLLAFGGLVLRYGPRHKRKGRLYQSIRAYFTNKRRKAGRVKTVEVEKEVEIVVEKIVEKEVVQRVEVPVEKVVVRDVIREVPVDKIVFQEVPKEIIRKELVYVPVFSDDVDLKSQKLDAA